jgi:hypothetical protein
MGSILSRNEPSEEPGTLQVTMAWVTWYRRSRSSRPAWPIIVGYGIAFFTVLVVLMDRVWIPPDRVRIVQWLNSVELSIETHDDASQHAFHYVARFREGGPAVNVERPKNKDYVRMAVLLPGYGVAEAPKRLKCLTTSDRLDVFEKLARDLLMFDTAYDFQFDQDRAEINSTVSIDRSTTQEQFLRWFLHTRNGALLFVVSLNRYLAEVEQRPAYASGCKPASA